MPVTIHCSHCGKVFQDRPSNHRKFCSHKCYSASKENKIQRTCEYCGKSFETIPAYLRKATAKNGDVRYCSRSCWREAHRKQKANDKKANAFRYTCKNCGRNYMHTRDWAGSGSTFCSSKCQYDYRRAHPDETPNWKGGKTSEQDILRKGSKYNEWRIAVFERDDYTCQNCGKRGGRLHAHHKKPFAEFPELRFDVANGETLCIYCHNDLHPQNLIGLSNSSPHPHKDL